MPTGVDLQFSAAAWELLYLCGVASPYKWANNAHLAFRATPGSLAPDAVQRRLGGRGERYGYTFH